MAGNRLKLNMDKTELLWAGTRRLLRDFTFPSLQLAVDGITPKQHVECLELSSRPISASKIMSPTQCRLRHIRRMLTAESAATLVHYFVMSRVDAAAPKVITNKLQRVMNAAAHVLAGTRKFDHGLMQLMHENLHWLDVPERVKYKVIILTRCCLIGTVPHYLAADCVSVPDFEMAQKRHLRSAAGYQLVVRSYRLNSCGLRVFSALGPRIWNSLPRLLRDTIATTLKINECIEYKLLSLTYKVLTTSQPDYLYTI